MSDEQPQPDGQEWLTTNQAIEIYRVSQSTVQRWANENKVVSKRVGRTLFVTKPSVDAHLVRLKEEKKARDLALSERRKAQETVLPSVSDQGEVARLKKQVQELSYENGRLNGEVGVYEKELNRMYTLIQNLLVPQK